MQATGQGPPSPPAAALPAAVGASAVVSFWNPGQSEALAQFNMIAEGPMDRHGTMNRPDSETPVVTTTNRARAGVTGHNVRYVLVIGTLSVAVLFGGLW